ncbi:SCAN domain-containing protein 1-like [Ovis aries]|nr:SCAN domain-containing protein 1-like [Ovis aries]XP_042100538.1 SCAN domain-containing protein 1-like [Ovis aries]XP_052513774.1 SCAN domain-containing protein 1-like [Budorcas taxicolor]XP_052518756.1 SCAN domain-containing protein 1-like [Budorcas taxicolor]
METEGYPEMQRDGEVQNDEIRSPSNERMAEEPEGILIAPPQVQVPPESLDEDSEDDLETVPRRSPLNPAASRQRFREFRYEDAAGPRDVLRHLQELAGQWLRPDIHTKEQIVEMLVQEQFQAVLPEELRAWALRCQPGVRITG